MRKKLRSRRGFSLTETLLCVALLALMTAAGTTVASTVLSTRNDMMEVADSQVLASTVLEAVANEIRYGEDVTLTTTTTGDPPATTTTLTLTSSTFGEKTEFLVPDATTAGSVTVSSGSDNIEGHVLVTSSAIDNDSTSGTTEAEALLPESAYTMALQVESLTFAQGDGGSVKITVKVSGRGDHAWEKSLTVTPMNGLIIKP